MSKNGKNNVAKKSAEKKAIILETKKRNRLPMLAVSGIAILVIAAAAFFMIRNNGVATVVADSSNTEVSATSVTYPVELFADGKARHFSYKVDDSITIQYFILKSSDGIIRAAFDACDVCWPAGKGYQQSGDVMICRNCGRKFASVLVNEVKGGCNPAPLNRKVEDGKVVLQINDILSGKQYYNFSKRG
ncbi:MAG: DUF2318 domain-containing protein [Desulfobacteraceae bacterium]|nr:DUF2318 domain-containing protein [Desulfobacteraceae bacterium]